MDNKTYWIAVKTSSSVMFNMKIHNNPASIKKTMENYGAKLVVEGKNIMVFSGKKMFVWLRHRIDNQTISDCQQICQQIRCELKQPFKDRSLTDTRKERL